MNELDPRDPDAPFEEHIARVLAATHAAADPAVLARARSRVAALAGTAEPAWLRWLARPVALALAGGALALSVTAGVWVLRTIPVTSAEQGAQTASSGAQALAVTDLLGDNGTYGLELGIEAGGDGSGAVLDTGAAR